MRTAMNETGRTERDRYWAAFGAWVRRRLAEMEPDRWTQQRLRDELAGIGIAVKREWVNQVINGKPPSDDLRKGIERLLGDFPDPSPTDTIDPKALLEAMAAQTDVIRALVDEMRLAREVQASHQRAEIAEAVREAVQPLWDLVRAATQPPVERAPGEATHGERR